MSKHTPGPWHVCLNELMRDDSYVITTGEDVTGEWIASVRAVIDDETLNVRGEEHQANARLIAAAPDLLAACLLAMPVVAEFGWTDHERDVFRALRNATNKALGEASKL